MYCENWRCSLHKLPLHPPEELRRALPGMQVGTDAWAEIARLRFTKKMKRGEIKQDLADEHGFVISERHIENLADLFGALLSGAHLKDPWLIETLKASGRLVISIDAAKPLKDDDPVWFVRDALTGNALAAATLRSSTAEDLRALMRPVKEFAKLHGIPIVGAISDGERNIRKAIRKELHGVPHQICQIHFVKNLAELVQAEDNALRKGLKERIHGLRQLERDVEADVKRGKLSKKQGEILQSLYGTLQSILKDSGKPPFKPAGLKLYARLEELRAELLEMARGHKSESLEAVLQLLTVLDELKTDQEWIRSYYVDILETGKILFAEGQTSGKAKQALKKLKAKWEDELKQLEDKDEDPDAQEVLREWIRLTTSYFPGLFHCYANPYIPATNNGMEKFIGDLKKLEQFIANNPRPAKRFVKNAPLLAFVFKRQNLPSEEFLRSRRAEDINKAKAYLETRRKRASIAYQARRDFTGTIKSLREQWQLASPDAPSSKDQTSSDKAGA
jgi:hypothetical protein